jgi:hypothetical protein
MDNNLVPNEVLLERLTAMGEDVKRVLVAIEGGPGGDPPGLVLRLDRLEQERGRILMVLGAVCVMMAGLAADFIGGLFSGHK